MNKLIYTLFAVLSLGLFLNAEDYQCFNVNGCLGRHVEDGVLIDEVFRYGDMVSTDAGYMVSTDDGWIKIKTHGLLECPPSLTLIGNQVYGVRSFVVAEARVVVLQPLLTLNSASGLNDTGVLASYTMPTWAYNSIVCVQVP